MNAINKKVFDNILQGYGGHFFYRNKHYRITRMFIPCGYDGSTCGCDNCLYRLEDGDEVCIYDIDCKIHGCPLIHVENIRLYVVVGSKLNIEVKSENRSISRLQEIIL